MKPLFCHGSDMLQSAYGILQVCAASHLNSIDAWLQCVRGNRSLEMVYVLRWLQLGSYIVRLILQ